MALKYQMVAQSLRQAILDGAYRDTMLQERVAIDQLPDILRKKTDMRELLKQIKL